MQKKLSNSVKIKLIKLDRNKILEELKLLVKDWIKICKLKLVVLFGSLSKGTYHIGSDADILIVAEDIPQNFSERFDMFFTPNLSIGLHPVIYTTEELFREINKPNTFIIEIFHNFELLYGEQNFLDTILDKIKYIINKRQLIRHSYGWEIKK